MKTFHLQIVTLDGVKYDGDAEKLIVRTTTGDVCILANHIDYVTPIAMGEARVTIDGEVKTGACVGGMLSVSKGEVTLVPSTFEWSNEIDVDRAERAKARAEEKLSKTTDINQQKLLEVKIKRALLRSYVAKK